jgi:hypothetical protein
MNAPEGQRKGRGSIATRTLTGVILGAVVCAAATVQAAPAHAAVGDYWVVAGDQASNQLIAFDPAVADWNSSSAVKWSWKPTSTRGFSSAEISGMGNVSDFKLRDTDAGQRFVVAASAGLVAIADYPSGNRIWGKVLSGNLHSAELLPDGNIAVAASTGGWVRVYNSSQGSSASGYAQYNLTAAHATLWDPSIMRLWVIGQDPATAQNILTALRVGGTAASPTLVEDTSRRAFLPSSGGHDVSPYNHDPGKLWVSTAGGVYLYDKTTKTFTVPASGNRTSVKSIGNQPSGQLVETKPDTTKSPAGACSVDTWCTDTVDFYSPDMTRRRIGAQFYKARVWSPYYNALDQTLHGRVWDSGRAAGGTWSTPTMVDSESSVTRVSSAALPDGTVHVQTVIPGKGVYDNTRLADGTWTGPVMIDSSALVTAVAAAALPDGTLHVQTLAPAYGVYDRTRSVDGTWSTTTKIDSATTITEISAAALPDGTLHVQTLVPNAGVYDRTRSVGGTWSTTTKIDSATTITEISAAALPDGTLHVQTLVPNAGVYDRTRSVDGTWSGATKIDSNGFLRAVAATGLPDGTLHVITVDPGTGAWERIRAGSGAWGDSASADDNGSILTACVSALPDGTMHLNTVPDIR